MKKYIALSLISGSAFALSSVVSLHSLAAEHADSKINAEIGKSVSHNPITGTTTTTVTKKRKKSANYRAGKFKRTNTGEDTRKIQKQVTADGTSEKITTETVHETKRK